MYLAWAVLIGAIMGAINMEGRKCLGRRDRSLQCRSTRQSLHICLCGPGTRCLLINTERSHAHQGRSFLHILMNPVNPYESCFGPTYSHWQEEVQGNVTYLMQVNGKCYISSATFRSDVRSCSSSFTYFQSNRDLRSRENSQSNLGICLASSSDDDREKENTGGPLRSGNQNQGPGLLSPSCGISPPHHMAIHRQ